MSGSGPPALDAVLESARERGFLGAGPVERHVAHAGGFLEAFRAISGDEVPDPVLDLGSGGGVPGLVIAALLPEHRVLLLDGSLRRAEFLTEAVDLLGWGPRVTVVGIRAEDAGRSADLRGGIGLITARSFAAPPVTAECAAPLLRAGGFAVVSEPPRGGMEARVHPQGPMSRTEASPDLEDPESVRRPVDEDRWPRELLRRELGLVPIHGVSDEFGYVVLEQVDPCPDRFPRRVGVPEKRPLYRVERSPSEGR